MGKRDDRRRADGYSVIELMIAIALTAIVTSQLLLVWTSQHQNYIQQERVSETQQDMRLITDVLINDLRMAGFMVPKETAAGSNDGGILGPTADFRNTAVSRSLQT